MIYKMAFRNIFRQKRRSAFTSIGMIFGMVVISFSISLTEGTYSSIIDTFTKSNTGHVQIHAKDYLEIPSIYKSIKETTKLDTILKGQKEIKSFTTRVYSGGLAFFNKKSTGVYIQGIDTNKEKEVTGLNLKWDNGVRFSNNNQRAIVISRHMSHLLKINIKDQLVIISQGVDGSIANDMYEIIGLYDEKNHSGSPNLVYIPIKTLQEFLSMGELVHEYSILLNSIDQSKSVSKKLNSIIKDDKIHVSPWQIVIKDFYKAMQVDKKGNLVTLFIIILVVSIGILNTVLMSILERTREFGVLKAIGTSPFNIFKLIVLENSLLAIFSMIIGILISFNLVYYFSIHEIKLSTPLNYGGLEFSGMKAVLSFKGIFVPALVVYFSTLIVSIWPAIRAARIIPIKAMSDH